MKYEFEISIDLGNALPEVGALLKEMNTGLSNFGCSERLMLRSKLLRGNIESKRKLTTKEIEKVKKALQEAVTESNPEWKAKIESFRRKSGNVQQSVA